MNKEFTVKTEIAKKIGTYLYERDYSPTFVSQKDKDMLFLVIGKCVVFVSISDNDDFIGVGYLSKENGKYHLRRNADVKKAIFSMERILKCINGVEEGIRTLPKRNVLEDCEFDNPADVLDEYVQTLGKE